MTLKRTAELLLLAGIAACMLAAPGRLRAQSAPPVQWTVTVYTKDNAPPAPKLEDLPLQASVSQYGITWTFEKPARVGRFINGDWYVVGPVTVTAIDPAPKPGRNGSMLNPRQDPKSDRSAYDDREGSSKRYYDANLAVALPVRLAAGDSLVSSISYAEGDTTSRKNTPIPGADAWIKTAAVLTCLAAPVPPDTFRPSYSGKQPPTYRFSNLHLDLLPAVEPLASAPKLDLYGRIFERPWLDHVYGWGSRHVHAVENMPSWGADLARTVSQAALLLECNYPLEEKKTLLVGFVQYGIDLWGVVQAGGKGWPAEGGYGLGRKWPILFAGILFQDEAMQHPRAEFDEDEHTAFGKCWTGAWVIWTGQSPGFYKQDPNRYWDRGPYEHLTPDKWGFDKSITKLPAGVRRSQLPGRMGDGYRRSCSPAYPGQALAARLMKAEKIWGHDAFFVYADRWMCEDETEPAKAIRKALMVEGVPELNYELTLQGKTRLPFVDDMWAKYRAMPGMPPTDDWRKEHKDPAAGKGE